MTTGPKRTPIQREDDLRRISELYLRGWRQVDIATEIGISQGMVSQDLKLIQKRWRKQTAVNMDEAKNKELARIDALEREYWEAWERSKGEQVKGRQKQSDTGGKKKIEWATVEKVQLIGNPAFLAGVEKCIDMRCKLLGIYAATKVDAVTRNIDLTKLTGDQLDRIAAGEDPIQVILSGYVSSDSSEGGT
jgi:hypothetical protein